MSLELSYCCDLDPQRVLTFPVLEVFDNGGFEVKLAVPSADYDEDGRAMHLVVDRKSRTVRLMKDPAVLGETDKHRILVGAHAITTNR